MENSSNKKRPEPNDEALSPDTRAHLKHNKNPAATKPIQCQNSYKSDRMVIEEAKVESQRTRVDAKEEVQSTISQSSHLKQLSSEASASEDLLSKREDKKGADSEKLEDVVDKIIPSEEKDDQVKVRNPEGLEVEVTKQKYQVIEPLQISPNPLHKRFQTFGASSLKIYESRTFKEMDKALDRWTSEVVTTERLLFIYGPVGVGKSFALALFIVRQKKKVEWMSKNMIFYVNNPHSFSNEYFFNELEETIKLAQLTKSQNQCFKKKLFTAFENILESSNQQPENDIADMSLKDLIDFLRDNNTLMEDETMECYVDVLCYLIEATKKNLVVMIDQALTGYSKASDINILPTPFQIFVREMIKRPVFEFKVLFCTSRQNPSEWRNYFGTNSNTIKVGEKFTDEEANSFLEEHFSFKNFEVESPEKRQQLLKVIRTETRNIPYELAQICEVSSQCLKGDVDELLTRYYQKRKKEIKNIHQNYVNYASQEDKDSFFRYLAYSRLGLPITSSNENCLDQNLCYLEDNETGTLKLLRFYHPLFQNYLENLYDIQIKTVIESL